MTKKIYFSKTEWCEINTLDTQTIVFYSCNSGYKKPYRYRKIGPCSMETHPLISGSTLCFYWNIDKDPNYYSNDEGPYRKFGDSHKFNSKYYKEEECTEEEYWNE